MRHDTLPIPMPATGQTGDPRDISELKFSSVVIDDTSAGAFSIKVQMRVGNLWTDLDAGPITASKVVSVADANGYPIAAQAIRIVSTTTGAPAPAAWVSGYNHRSH